MPAWLADADAFIDDNLIVMTGFNKILQKVAVGELADFHEYARQLDTFKLVTVLMLILKRADATIPLLAGDVGQKGNVFATFLRITCAWPRCVAVQLIWYNGVFVWRSALLRNLVQGSTECWR